MLVTPIFAATGKRIYHLLIGGFDLKKAGIQLLNFDGSFTDVEPVTQPDQGNSQDFG